MKKIKENWIEWTVKIMAILLFGSVLISLILQVIDCSTYTICNGFFGFKYEETTPSTLLFTALL